MTVTRKQCARCGGAGTVLRERRKLADGSPDPLDFRQSEICPPCGGAGSVLDEPPRSVKGAGWVADSIVKEPTT